MSLFGHKAPVVDVLIVRHLDSVVSFAEDGVSVLDFEERNCENCTPQDEEVGRDSPVGIVTRCGLDGPGIESRWKRDIPHLSRPVLGPTQPPIQWVPGLFPRG
jgi:hypothetical protein